MKRYFSIQKKNLTWLEWVVFQIMGSSVYNGSRYLIGEDLTHWRPFYHNRLKPNNNLLQIQLNEDIKMKRHLYNQADLFVCCFSRNRGKQIRAKELMVVEKENSQQSTVKYNYMPICRHYAFSCCIKRTINNRKGHKKQERKK